MNRIILIEDIYYECERNKHLTESDISILLTMSSIENELVTINALLLNPYLPDSIESKLNKMKKQLSELYNSMENNFWEIHSKMKGILQDENNN